jgi:hypothetical protein
MRKLLLPTIAVLVVLFTSCRTANKLYTKGNYDEAFYKAVKNTTSAKSYQKNSTLITNSYTNAVDDLKEELSQLSNYNNDNSWSRKITLFEKIEALNNTANRNVFVRGTLNLYDVSSLLAEAKQGDIDYRISYTETLMATNQKSKIVEAYKYAQNSSYKYPTNNALQVLVQKAFDSGKSTVAIQISNSNHYNASYSYSQREALAQLERNVINELNFKGKENLITFVNNNYQTNNNIKIDYLVNLQMQYNDADIVRTNASNTNVSKNNIVIREVVIRPDSIVREYGTVNAIYTENEKYIDARADMNIQIRKADSYFNNYNRNFNENYKWSTKTFSYSGDVRALSNEQKNSLSQTGQTQPHKSTILNNLEQEAINTLSYEVMNYFRNEFR